MGGAHRYPCPMVQPPSSSARFCAIVSTPSAMHSILRDFASSIWWRHMVAYLSSLSIEATNERSSLSLLNGISARSMSFDEPVPKSSMATLYPSVMRYWTLLLNALVSLTEPLSSISRVMYFGLTTLSVTVFCRRFIQRSSRKSSGEALMLNCSWIPMLDSFWFMSRQASNIRKNNVLEWPRASSMGIKKDGGIKPIRGWCQRHNASAPIVLPEVISIWG